MFKTINNLSFFYTLKEEKNFAVKPFIRMKIVGNCYRFVKSHHHPDICISLRAEVSHDEVILRNNCFIKRNLKGSQVSQAHVTSVEFKFTVSQESRCRVTGDH